VTLDKNDLRHPDASDPLRSPTLKICRARILIQELKTRISDYTRIVPCNLLIAPHPEVEGKTVVVARVEGTIPEEIALIAGDVVHNLRTSLDHVVCCLVAENGQSMDDVSFPFARSARYFKKSASKKIRKIPTAAKILIKRLKPYRGGNDFLYCLHELDIRDKHRTLTLCTIYMGSWSGTFSCDHPIDVSAGPFAPLEQGVHLFTFPTGAKFEQNLGITFTISLADVEGANGEPIIDLLTKFVRLCERIIGIFERRFFT